MNKNNKGTCLLLNKIVQFLVCVKISKLWWWHSSPNEPTMDHSQMWLHKCEWINVECNVPTFCAVSVLLFFFFPSFFFLLNFLHEACNKSFSLLALVTFFSPSLFVPQMLPHWKIYVRKTPASSWAAQHQWPCVPGKPTMPCFRAWTYPGGEGWETSSPVRSHLLRKTMTWSLSLCIWAGDDRLQLCYFLHTRFTRLFSCLFTVFIHDPWVSSQSWFCTSKRNDMNKESHHSQLQQSVSY